MGGRFYWLDERGLRARVALRGKQYEHNKCQRSQANGREKVFYDFHFGPHLLLDKVYDDNGPTFAAPIPNLCGIGTSDGGTGTVPHCPLLPFRPSCAPSADMSPSAPQDGRHFNRRIFFAIGADDRRCFQDQQRHSLPAYTPQLKVHVSS